MRERVRHRPPHRAVGDRRPRGEPLRHLTDAVGEVAVRDDLGREAQVERLPRTDGAREQQQLLAFAAPTRRGSHHDEPESRRARSR